MTAPTDTAFNAGVRAALAVKKPDVSRRYCTNDEAFYNEGFEAAMTAIKNLLRPEAPNFGDLDSGTPNHNDHTKRGFDPR